jgi:diadenosine tetraphosphate (Ap4A) HIT family hydrolase
VLAFHDINPLAPVHVLVIPKGPYVSWDDFSESGSDAEMAALTRAIGEVARMVGADAQGYRLLSNVGKRAGQEVAHLHVHVFGGQPLGAMLSR